MTRSLAGVDTTTDMVLEGIDLSGKTALVTGASSGLGVETARALASRGARVILAARNREKTEAVATSLREATGNDAISVLVVDLSRFGSIREAAQELSSRIDALDLLINNAGVMACPLDRTPEGLEMQFGTNHIGHFLLTCLLVPLLEAAPSARVVNLSSGGHKYSPVLFDDWNFERREYDKWVSYGQAKTANSLFAVALDKRLRGAGVRAFAVHPGAIYTELGRHLTREDIEQMLSGVRGSAEPLKMKTLEQGAATTVWAATAPELEGRGGLYLEDCHIAEPIDEASTVDGVMGYALDEEAAERLWTLSEEIVGERFVF